MLVFKESYIPDCAFSLITHPDCLYNHTAFWLEIYYHPFSVASWQKIHLIEMFKAITYAKLTMKINVKQTVKKTRSMNKHGHKKGSSASLVQISSYIVGINFVDFTKVISNFN